VTTYVLRRLLLMIPTLIGISFIVWLVMALAPGRLGEQGGTMGSATEDMSKDSTKEGQENEGEAIFRRQFGLDRPRFFNDWYDLSAATVRRKIEMAHDDKQVYGISERREAKNDLLDYGYYAVPPLMGLLNSTEGIEQDRVRYWLGRCSYRRIYRAYGTKLDEETIARYQAWTAENRELSKWKWEAGASPEERAQVATLWNEWFQKNADRCDYDGWDRFKISVADTQFGTYWGKLLQGQLGYSHVHKRPVGDLVLERMKYSLSLNLVALLIAYMLAVPLGIFTAAKQGSLWDKGIGLVVFMLYSLPNYFVGTLLLKWLAVGEPYEIFPSGGFEAEDSARLSTFQHLGDILWHITLPLVCLSYGGLAFLSRFARSGMLDVIRSDYVRTARAKGLSGMTVILKHVVRNGILPIVTLLGSTLPVLIGGSVAIEYIFNINGMGLLMINSIFQKDFNVVMGVQLMIGVLTMIGILIADIAYAVLDPRISLS
jgi:peptide/nickel transport system permease protein